MKLKETRQVTSLSIKDTFQVAAHYEQNLLLFCFSKNACGGSSGGQPDKPFLHPAGVVQFRHENVLLGTHSEHSGLICGGRVHAVHHSAADGRAR